MNPYPHGHQLTFRMKSGHEVQVRYGDQTMSRVLREDHGTAEDQLREMATEIIKDHDQSFHPETFAVQIARAIDGFHASFFPAPPPGPTASTSTEDVLARFM